MDVIDTADKAKFSAEKMQKISLFSTDDALVDLYCIRPDQQQKVHSHMDFDKFYYVIDGEATVQIGGEVCRVGPGHVALARRGVDHGVRNDGASDLTLLVMMAPKPDFG